MPENLPKRIRRPNNTHYVYALLRENGEPFYVGMGKGNRWNFHEREARQKTLGSNPHKTRIIRGMLAAGWVEIPKIKLIESVSRKAALDYEKAIVAAFGRWPDGPLVNMTDAGEDPPPCRGHSAATRAKIGAANRGKKRPEGFQRGRKLSAVSRAKMSAAAIGRKASDEARAKMSATRTGKKQSVEAIAKSSAARRGQKHTKESRAKMSAAQSGKKQSAETRAKRSAALRGRQFSEETRAKLSAALRGRQFSEETRAKMRTSSHHRWHGPTRRDDLAPT